jgi:hypothetical protein
MDFVLDKFQKKELIKSGIFNLLALLVVYLTPVFSHLISLPIYYIEPMRLILILAIAHTSHKNAYLLALTLPLVSFLFSGHPSLLKTSLITGELVLNVFLFYQLQKIFNTGFVTAILSIIFSKLLYYILKFALIQFSFINSDLISTPIYIQIVMMIVFSSYVFILSKK